MCVSCLCVHMHVSSVFACMSMHFHICVVFAHVCRVCVCMCGCLCVCVLQVCVWRGLSLCVSFSLSSLFGNSLEEGTTAPCIHSLGPLKESSPLARCLIEFLELQLKVGGELAVQRVAPISKVQKRGPPPSKGHGRSRLADSPGRIQDCPSTQTPTESARRSGCPGLEKQ